MTNDTHNGHAGESPEQGTHHSPRPSSEKSDNEDSSTSPSHSELSDVDVPCNEVASGVESPENGSSAVPNIRGGQYIPPHLRRHLELAGEGQRDKATREVNAQHLVIRREVRSLLNRVASANVGTNGLEISAMFNEHPRHLIIDAIIASTMQVRHSMSPHDTLKLSSVTLATLRRPHCTHTRTSMCCKAVPGMPWSYHVQIPLCNAIACAGWNFVTAFDQVAREVGRPPCDAV